MVLGGKEGLNKVKMVLNVVQKLQVISDLW